MDGKLLKQLITDTDRDPQSYSGRGMYGKRCVAVGLESQSELWDLAIAMSMAARNLEEDDAIPAPRTDSFGLGIIAYWPGVEWVADEE